MSSVCTFGWTSMISSQLSVLWVIGWSYPPPPSNSTIWCPINPHHWAQDAWQQRICVITMYAWSKANIAWFTSARCEARYWEWGISRTKWPVESTWRLKLSERMVHVKIRIWRLCCSKTAKIYSLSFHSRNPWKIRKIKECTAFYVVFRADVRRNYLIDIST